MDSLRLARLRGADMALDVRQRLRQFLPLERMRLDLLRRAAANLLLPTCRLIHLQAARLCDLWRVRPLFVDQHDRRRADPRWAD